VSRGPPAVRYTIVVAHVVVVVEKFPPCMDRDLRVHRILRKSKLLSNLSLHALFYERQFLVCHPTAMLEELELVPQ
jgi:hypothetical protein